MAAESNSFDPSLYEEYGVKRGLRNQNGTGVLVGLTQIGDVHGYVMEDGNKLPAPGRLSYRGIDVEDIVRNCHAEGRLGFEEVSFLLLFGKLPKRDELEQFITLMGRERRLPDGFIEDMILKAPSNNIMNKLARCVLASYSYDDNPDDNSIKNLLTRCISLIAKFPAFVAYAFQAKSHYYHNQSLYIHIPREDQHTAESFLYMIRPDRNYTQLEAETLDLSLILHAEHGGGNNSAFATRVVTSSGTDTYSAIATGVSSLKGPKHGGANLKVMEMVENIKANVSNWKNEGQLKDYLVKILKREAFDRSGLIYGMGHAVYTMSDPRAVLLKEKARELAIVNGMEDEFNLYSNIERITPEIFAEVRCNGKAMCANVDLYSGLVYKMLNIPMALYTPIFAIARVPGWCAHRIEEIISGGRIIRPAYRSLADHTEYIPIDER
jgi:citrate synthase